MCQAAAVRFVVPSSNKDAIIVAKHEIGCGNWRRVDRASRSVQIDRDKIGILIKYDREVMPLIQTKCCPNVESVARQNILCFESRIV